MQLTQEQHNVLIDWIERYIIPIENINPKVDTSDIRKAFMDAYKYGFYLDNNTLNGIMIGLGFQFSHCEEDPYLWFNVSTQSPALREYHQWALNPSAYEKYE